MFQTYTLDGEPVVSGLEFQYNWMTLNAVHWNAIFEQTKVQSYLEIGSFDGQSACFVLAQMGRRDGGHVCCVDPWLSDHDRLVVPGTKRTFMDMPEVRKRFYSNTKLVRDACATHVDMEVHEGLSRSVLPALIMQNKQYDVVYVDGSHYAADVLTDLVFSFELCRPGGIIIVDDYLWRPCGLEARYDTLLAPKVAIDAFTTCYYNRILILEGWLRQMYIVKATNPLE